MQKGDFLRIDYIGRIALTGEIFDLTDEAKAKKEGIHNPRQSYGPILVIIGSGMAIPGVEKNLLEMKVGEEREFDVSRGEGFGKRDPRLIKIISYQKFISQKINPVPGAFVNIDGRHARIQSVSGGRVRVDFNNPLAGKDLHYKLKIVKKITSPQEKAQSIIDHYGLKVTATLKEKILTIKTEAKLHDAVKNFLNKQITQWIKEIKKINYVSPKEKSEDKKSPGEKTVKIPEENAQQKPKPI